MLLFCYRRYWIDRAGRRKLLLGSLAGVAAALCLLGGAFHASDGASPAALPPPDSTCPALPPGANCAQCLHLDCGFCGGAGGPHALDPGACLAPADAGTCDFSPSAAAGGGAVGNVLYRNGCPSPYTGAIIAGLCVYLAAFSPGLGPVPWAVNAEIYPTQARGLMGGVAATANWVANAAVSQTFLSATAAFGAAATFWLIAGVAAGGAVWVYVQLPETLGLSLEEVQQLFAARVRARKRGGGAGTGGAGGGGAARDRRGGGTLGADGGGAYRLAVGS